VTRSRERLGVFLFAIGLLALFIAITFALGYFLGRMLL
jgi:hypothetical protein